MGKVSHMIVTGLVLTIIIGTILLSSEEGETDGRYMRLH